MWNNMHVLDLKSEDFQDVDLHDSWEDDDEDYDLVLASYHEPRKMSCKVIRCLHRQQSIFTFSWLYV